MIVGFGYVQHDGCDETPSTTTRATSVGELFNWLIFDNGYHTIHHMQPGLHWSLRARRTSTWRDRTSIPRSIERSLLLLHVASVRLAGAAAAL